MLVFFRWLARVVRTLGAWGELEMRPADVVWPALRDYPYGPVPR